MTLDRYEARRNSSWRSALLASAIMSDRNNDIPLFVSFVDIPMSLGHLFQPIASINDRFYLSRFSQLLD